MTAVATPVEIDHSLAQLRDGAKRWIALTPGAKAVLFERVRDATYAQAAAWAEAAADAKGLTGTPLAGEEWLSGPWAVIYALNRYIRSLREIERFGTPQIPHRRVRTRANGQVAVDVFPNGPYDTLLFNGIRAEVWMQPGVTPATLSETMAVWYKRRDHVPRVALVLGAGNIAAIPPLDVFYKLIADGAVCVLKMNPVNEYLGPIFERALKPLVDEGFLRFAYGGPDVGKLLCAHPLVDEIHITGSDKTHDRIVFGDGIDAADRKQRNDPVLRKPISSELGNVSPTIVVPGPWSDADFRFQAEQIVTQKMHNGGFNCIASQVLILPQSWDGTAKLLEQIEGVMREIADRPAYYPGAAERTRMLSDGQTGVSRFGKAGDGFTHRTIVVVDASSSASAFEVEAFSSILTVTTLPGDTRAFLEAAVAFANDRLWGTLGGNIVVHPKTMRDFGDELDAAIAGMRFGCVGVNAWTGVGFLLTETTWGAYPGHTLDDVRSGIGIVHNAYLFDRAEKSVVYAPFAEFPRSVFGYGSTLLPKPPWFITNKTADRTAKALVDFEMHKTPLTATGVAMLAMRG
ncbi:MAG: aldehyde dehydrogenase family protein [Candidatus Eremiobacteraeota bacterium]|nr:aldehyde dehydrogenase family protein [Candidatus Eremiobacteraeota bacterium]